MYPNKKVSVDLLKGFQEGFKIPYNGPRSALFSKNHKSAALAPEIIRDILLEEVQLGRVAGPFATPPVDNLRVSPIGLVPKSTPGKFRLIFDLSYPRGNSINAGILPEDASVQFIKFDKITDMVRAEGRGSYLIKLDIMSAFRLLPLHPSDFPLFGMYFENNYYIDKCLPFWLSVSCALFESFSTFLEWCIKIVTGSNQIVHYLDDFGGCNSSKDLAGAMLSNACRFLEKVGVPIANEKVEGPSTCLKFLGLEIDTVAMLVKIPNEKLVALRELINRTLDLDGGKMRLRDLQSLIGKLNFACRAIVPGRAFCRRLIDATCGLTQKFHIVEVKSSKLLYLKEHDQLATYHL